MGGEVVVCLLREAVVAWGFVLPKTVMAFRTSWMVKGRFSSCFLRTLARRSTLFWVSVSSVSWVGVYGWRKLS